MWSIAYRASLTILVVGALVTLVPFSFPAQTSSVVIGQSNQPTNVVIPLSLPYLKVSLEGLKLADFNLTRIELFQLTFNGSLPPVYNSSYTDPVTITISPGTYIVRVTFSQTVQPVKLVMNSFGVPPRQIETGLTLAISGMLYPVASRLTKKRESKRVPS